MMMVMAKRQSQHTCNDYIEMLAQKKTSVIKKRAIRKKAECMHHHSHALSPGDGPLDYGFKMT